MTPGPANTGDKRRVQAKLQQNGPTAGSPPSASVSRAGSRAASPSPVPSTGGNRALLPSSATPPIPATPGAARPPRPSTPGAPTTAQLLRRIAVAGVTVEVVRQDSTIIYRLPGNMPVSSLTPEQRAKVMQEIQRLRDSSQASSGRTAQQSGLARPQRPPPMPRSSTLPNSPRSGFSATPPQAMQTRGAAAYPSAPTTPTSAPTYRQQRSLAPGLAPIRPQPASALSPASAVPKTELERMYESAYLKLLSGPAEVLRKLSPPIELSSIVKRTASASGSSNGASDDVIDPHTLLQILKALTKSQAAQLAGMYNLDVRAGRDPLDVNTRGLRSSAPSSAMSSREVSPSAGSMSGTDFDSSLDMPGSGATTPRVKRKYTKNNKYIKTGKYSKFGKALSHLSPATMSPESPADFVPATAPVEQPPKRPVVSAQSTSPQAQSYPMYAHPDVNRAGCESLSRRRTRPYQAQHEAEVSRRFRVALAMDHQMVQAPDWRTPFNGPRDVVQRLLPFHVFQYPDSAIESGIKMEEDRAAKSAAGLTRRFQAISKRYDAILVNEGSDHYYDMQHILLDRQRALQAKSELAALREIKLQRDVASMLPSSSF
ncbi:hypothetical protein GGI00_001433 [Coemansia sp. RSA 2681]|nr:hypothetical protein GGI00_001433 [Coemansia sp. RSA 2681]